MLHLHGGSEHRTSESFGAGWGGVDGDLPRRHSFGWHSPYSGNAWRTAHAVHGVDPPSAGCVMPHAVHRRKPGPLSQPSKRCPTSSCNGPKRAVLSLSTRTSTSWTALADRRAALGPLLLPVATRSSRAPALLAFQASAWLLAHHPGRLSQTPQTRRFHRAAPPTVPAVKRVLLLLRVSQPAARTLPENHAFRLFARQPTSNTALNPAPNPTLCVSAGRRRSRRPPPNQMNQIRAANKLSPREPRARSQA